MPTAIAMTSRGRLDPDTQNRIEKAVLDIFSTREFHRIGLIEIARGANVSLQTIYKYYGSKEALLFSGLDSWFAQLGERVLPALDGTDHVRERLQQVFAATLDFFESNPKIMQIVMSSVYFNTWRRSIGQHNRGLIDALARLIAQGRQQGLLNPEVNDAVLLDFFVGVTLRLVQGYVLRGEHDSLVRQSDTLFDMLWRAVAAPPPAAAVA